MSLARQVRNWAGGTGLWRKIAIVLAAAALASGIATYLALTGAPPFGPGASSVLILLNLDLVLLLALAALVAKRLVAMSTAASDAHKLSPARACRSGWSGCSA